MSKWTFVWVVMTLSTLAATGCSSGGDSSSGSGSENACQAASGDNSCVACAKEKCCAEREACEGEPACPSTAQSIASCGSNKECASAIQEKAGQATYASALGIDHCLLDSCAHECGL